MHKEQRRLDPGVGVAVGREEGRRRKSSVGGGERRPLTEYA